MKALKKIVHVLSIVLIVILGAVIVFSLTSRVMGKTPSIFGFYIFRVSTDSMEPTLKVGDIILVKSVNAEDIRKNDIITYRSLDGSMYNHEVTHRVIAEPEIKNGEYHFQTQGDAPNSLPDRPITFDQVEGKYVRSLSLIGKLYNFICTPTGVAVFLGIIVVVFGYEMIVMLLSFRTIDKLEDEDDE